MPEGRTSDVEIEYSLLSGQEKAAIILSSLGKDATQSVFKHLKDNDVKKMINEMSKVTKTSVGLVKRLLEDFYGLLQEDNELFFSENKGKEFIVDTLGANRAGKLMDQISEMDTSGGLESLELVDEKTLANFLANEHPQTIALIVAYLKPEKKVEVLRRLPEELVVEVVLRLSNLDYVAPELIAQLDDVLKTELSALGSFDADRVGGVEPVADVLNLMDGQTEQTILSKVEEKDPDLAEEIRTMMFVFEDLVYVDDKGIQNLIKEVDPRQLAVAFKTASQDVKHKFFKNMSTRAMTLLNEDIEDLGPMKLSEVEKAQGEIVQKCRKLETMKKAFVSRTNDEAGPLV